MTTFNDTTEHDALQCDPLDTQQLGQVCQHCALVQMNPPASTLQEYQQPWD